MAIFKSHKVSFFAKLALLIPLSLITFFLAVTATFGGNGNFLPLMVLFGPLNIILEIMPIDGAHEEKFCFYGVILLYVLYAALLKFIKSNKTFVSFLIFHIMSAVITTALHFDAIFLNMRRDWLIYLLSMGIIALVLWGLIIWLLFSIYKSRGLW